MTQSTQFHLAVGCEDESCDAEVIADLLLPADADWAARYGAILDHATTQGWTVLGRGRPAAACAYCPEHTPDPDEDL